MLISIDSLLLCSITLPNGHYPGASSGSTDLLPAPSASTNWTSSLITDSGRDSDLIFRFDGRQAAKIPDQVVPQNLTDQFTIATWMKHGPSPGLRAEKETLLCNSDKTGEENCGRKGWDTGRMFYHDRMVMVRDMEGRSH